MNTPGWQVSALRVSGLAQVLARKGSLDEVLSRCSPATRDVFTRPHDARNHPSRALVEFNEAVLHALGAKALEDLNYEATRDAFSKVLRPVIAVAIAISGATPATIFARVPSSISQVLPGVTATWTVRSKTQGTLSIDYPGEISATFEQAWRGAVRFLSEFSRTPVRIDRFHLEGAAFVFELSW